MENGGTWSGDSDSHIYVTFGYHRLLSSIYVTLYGCTISRGSFVAVRAIWLCAANTFRTYGLVEACRPFLIEGRLVESRRAQDESMSPRVDPSLVHSPYSR